MFLPKSELHFIIILSPFLVQMSTGLPCYIECSKHMFVVKFLVCVFENFHHSLDLRTKDNQSLAVGYFETSLSKTFHTFAHGFFMLELLV